MKIARTAWINVNRQCNCRCSFCYAHNNLNKTEKLDYLKASDIIAKLSELGVKDIIFIGGEPTLYKKMPNLLRVVKSFDMTSTVVTNGIKFSNEDFVKLYKESGVTRCGLSIKGFTEEKFKTITETEYFSLQIAAIEQLRKHKIDTVYTYVISEPTIEEADQIIYGIEKFNVNEIYLSNVVKDSEFTDETAEMWNNCLKYLIDNLKSKKVRFKIRFSNPLCALNKTLAIPWLKEKILEPSQCMVRQGNKIVVDADYNLIPCNYFAGENEIRVQINKEHLEENLKILHAQERMRLYKKLPSAECFKCYRMTQCHGGCARNNNNYRGGFTFRHFEE